MPHTAYKKFFLLVQYEAGYNLGPVAPPRTDGASLEATLCVLTYMSGQL